MKSPRLKHELMAAAVLVWASLPSAQAHPGHDEVPEVAPVVITGHYNNAVGTSEAASQGVIGPGLLASRPAQRPGEVLEFVPGVIVTQHSGEGKANQYFLRGFNLDHGTDFAVSVGGVPVNLGSHGHGQGYADLNFLISELVQRVDYRKGPYSAADGDFSLAGAADIQYRTRLDAPFSQVSLGQHGYRRAVGGASGSLANGATWLAAAEATRADGPWEVPERLRKHGVVASLSWPGLTLRLQLSQADWTATDQVPQRALVGGTLGRFGSLDASSGGRTQRQALSAQWQRDGENTRQRASAWLLGYGLDLFSNFTYALERPASGDQFRQSDRRVAAGGRWEQTTSHELAQLASGLSSTRWGLQVRHDRVRLALADTQNRQDLETVREDRVQVTQLAAFAEGQWQWQPRLRSTLGLRWQYQHNQVQALTLPANGGNSSGHLLLPRLSVVAGPFFESTARTEFFLNAGRGFHSNDARGTTASQDPRTGEAQSAVPALAAGTGAELGLRSEPVKGLQTSIALWGLRTSSELLYVGDAGTTEAAAASRRRGVEWNNRYVPHPGLLVDADLAWNHARFADGSRIPNALDRVASVALTLRELGPYSLSLQGRYRGGGALLEDNTLRSHSAFTLNGRATRSFAGGHSLTLDVFNLQNRKVNDIEYAYESRLPSETQPVLDRHVHPALPRTLRLTLKMVL
jgi:TonB dependent receptor/TonB-dependent Receptor Plug Domain